MATPLGDVVQDTVDPFGDWDATPKRTTAKKVEPVLTEEARNAKLWSEANDDAERKPKATMYSIVSSASLLSGSGSISTTSSSSSTLQARVPPSAAVFPHQGPSLTILKRPSSASSSNSSSSKSAPLKQKSIAEREKEYEEARRRIYGGSPISNSSNNSTPASKANVSSNSATTGVVGGIGGCKSPLHTGSSTSIRSTDSNGSSTKGNSSQGKGHSSTVSATNNPVQQQNSSSTRKGKLKKEVYDPMVAGVSALSMSLPSAMSKTETGLNHKAVRSPRGPAEDGSTGFQGTNRAKSSQRREM